MTAPAPRRVLFLCRYNQRRSATAERVFRKRRDLDVRSAGTSPDALARVNALMLEWADVVFTMDPQQRAALEQMFPGHPGLERVVCLDIPDTFMFLQPELVSLLEERVAEYLDQYGPARRAPQDPPSSR
jgi:predicted protein tyrosine phosphatase